VHKVDSVLGFPARYLITRSFISKKLS